MAVQLTKIGNSPNVPAKEFICDTVEDIAKLPNAPMVSVCLCLGDKKVYIKGGDLNQGTNGWVIF